MGRKVWAPPCQECRVYPASAGTVYCFECRRGQLAEEEARARPQVTPPTPRKATKEPNPEGPMNYCGACLSTRGLSFIKGRGYLCLNCRIKHQPNGRDVDIAVGYGWDGLHRPSSTKDPNRIY